MAKQFISNKQEQEFLLMPFGRSIILTKGTFNIEDLNARGVGEARGFIIVREEAIFRCDKPLSTRCKVIIKKGGCGLFHVDVSGQDCNITIMRGGKCEVENGARCFKMKVESGGVVNVQEGSVISTLHYGKGATVMLNGGLIEKLISLSESEAVATFPQFLEEATNESKLEEYRKMIQDDNYKAPIIESSHLKVEATAALDISLPLYEENTQLEVAGAAPHTEGE